MRMLPGAVGTCRLVRRHMDIEGVDRGRVVGVALVGNIKGTGQRSVRVFTSIRLLGGR